MLISKLAIHRPVTVTMLFLTCVLTGLLAVKYLKQEFFPDIQFPGIYIEVPYQGSTAEEVEKNITRPMEEVLSTISNIDRLESNTRPDGVTIMLFFDWSENAKLKGVEAREKIDAIRADLPEDIRNIFVFTGSTGDEPVLRLRVSSDTVDLSSAYDLLDRYLKRPLEAVHGVSKVNIHGINKTEVTIALDFDRVSAHNIPLMTLSGLLSRSNFALSGGTFTENGRRYYVKPEGQFSSIESIKNLPIGKHDLKLSDIADVYYESPELDHGRRLDQKFAIALAVSRESDSNIVQVVEDVTKKLDEISSTSQLEGINIFVMDDQASGIKSSLSDIGTSGLLGFLLSIGVLFLFLRQLKLTLVVALAVPFALLITLSFMYLLGVSLNILSMMGLMLAVGMLVDNAVVVSESIYRYKQMMPDEPVKATLKGVQTVGVAVTAGTLTTAIVFLPNIIGDKIDITVFLSHVAITICIALAASLFIALTIIPLYLSRTPAKNLEGGNSRMFDGLKKRYALTLGWTLRHPVWSGLAAILIFLSIMVPASMVKSEMFPERDSRRLALHYHIQGTHTVEHIKSIVSSVEQHLYTLKEQTGFASIYSYYNGGQANSILLFDEDKDLPLPMATVKKLLLENMPEYSIATPSFERKRSGASEPLKIYLNGESTAELITIANTIMPLLSSLEGVVDVRSGVKTGNEEIQIVLDRDRISLLGLKTDQIAAQIASAIRGQNFRTLRTSEGEREIRMRLGGQSMQSAALLAQLPVELPNGETIPLSAIAHFNSSASPLNINRHNRKTSFAINLELDGLTMNEAVEQLTPVMSGIALPPGYTWSFGRSFDREQRTATIMLMNMLLAIMMIYVVMAALFESLLFPTAVISSIAYAVVGVYWFFLITDTSLSMMANIGILVLMGVVVNNGIVLVDHINQLRKEGLPRDKAIIQAGSDRLRPILMTVLTTILGLVPLAIGDSKIGSGGPSYYPMARAIIGGLAFSTVVTLIILPTIYIALDNLGQWSSKVMRASRIKSNRMSLDTF